MIANDLTYESETQVHIKNTQTNEFKERRREI